HAQRAGSRGLRLRCSRAARAVDRRSIRDRVAAMRKLQPAALAIAAATTAFLGSGAPAAGAQGKPAAASAAASPLRTFALDNGLTVVPVERPGLPMVTVQVWYRFGSRHEPAGQRGAARVIEKIMFDGSA